MLIVDRPSRPSVVTTDTTVIKMRIKMPKGTIVITDMIMTMTRRMPKADGTTTTTTIVTIGEGITGRVIIITIEAVTMGRVIIIIEAAIMGRMRVIIIEVGVAIMGRKITTIVRII